MHFPIRWAIFITVVSAAVSLRACELTQEASAPAASNELRAELRAVEAVLPRGWSAALMGSEIRIRRDTPILNLHPIPNASGEDQSDLAVRVDNWFYWSGAATTKSGRIVEMHYYEAEVALSFGCPLGKQTYHLATTKPDPNHVRTDVQFMHDVFQISVTFSARLSPEQYEFRRQENHKMSDALNSLQEKIDKSGISHKFGSYLPTTDEQKKLVAELNALRERRHILPTHYSAGHSISIENSETYLAKPVNDDDNQECSRVVSAVSNLYTPYAHSSDEHPSALDRAKE
jgi:hypothetical protein